MNDTAKPTSTQGCSVKLWDRANFRYFVSDEAVDVYYETNLTPRQLLERVKELEGAQTDLIRELRHLMGVVEGYMFDAGDGIHVADTLADAAALIAKHGEGV